MALAIEILLAAAVLLAVGLAAAGRIDGMSRSAPDAPPGLAPGPVTPEALRAVALPVVIRGYRMADVDEVLERAAAELEAARSEARPASSAYAVEATAGPPDQLWDDETIDG
jgi:DivIVA domain-containing protein